MPYIEYWLILELNKMEKAFSLPQTVGDGADRPWEGNWSLEAPWLPVNPVGAVLAHSEPPHGVDFCFASPDCDGM